MRIQEIADITGLSKKAINLYEKKGMLQVFRDDSGYRCYTQEHVRILMQIKMGITGPTKAFTFHYVSILILR